MAIAAAAFVAACMLVASVAYFVLRYLPPGCLTPHFRKCDGMRWNQLGERRRSQWYYIITNFGEHCLLWDPDKVSCFNKSQLHFGSKADCQEQCENETLDRWCGSHVSETMVDCRESGNADVAENTHWWFYDAYLGSCQNWSDVCIDYWFNSLEQCAYMCLP